jgi:DNA polymerase IIIc chi subunit
MYLIGCELKKQNKLPKDDEWLFVQISYLQHNDNSEIDHGKIPIILQESDETNNSF